MSNSSRPLKDVLTQRGVVFYFSCLFLTEGLQRHTGLPSAAPHLCLVCGKRMGRPSLISVSSLSVVLQYRCPFFSCPTTPEVRRYISYGPWFCMVDTRQGANFPLWGNDSARETARCARLSAPAPVMPHAPPPPPLECGRSPPYLRLVTGVRLVHPGSSLAEATFAPAQPPFIVTELLGEKTNLTQKKPYRLCMSALPGPLPLASGSRKTRPLSPCLSLRPFRVYILHVKVCLPGTYTTHWRFDQAARARRCSTRWRSRSQERE